MQGLLDQYTVAGNPKALDMVVSMADYFSNRVKNVIQKYSIERHWTSLNEETGGMNDVLYQLYTITVIALCSYRSLFRRIAVHVQAAFDANSLS